MSEIDFSKALRDFDGREMVGPDAETGEMRPVTLASVCVNALHALMDASQRKLTGEQKIKRGLLARQIYTAGEEKKPLVLTPDDIVLLKDAIAEAYPSPRIVLGSWEMLAPASVKKLAGGAT